MEIRLASITKTMHLPTFIEIMLDMKTSCKTLFILNRLKTFFYKHIYIYIYNIYITLYIYIYISYTYNIYI